MVSSLSPEARAVIEAHMVKSQRVRNCVYLATEETVADDIAATIDASITYLQLLLAALAQVEQERDEARRMTEERSSYFAMFPATLARAEAAEATLRALQAAKEER